jgi:hypothetical protein
MKCSVNLYFTCTAGFEAKYKGIRKSTKKPVKNEHSIKNDAFKNFTFFTMFP